MSLDFKNIGMLFGINGLNIALNVAYSTLIVQFFGTSSQVEAFFAASVLGTAVSRFVNTGQLVEIVVSRYHRIKQKYGVQAGMSIIATLCNYMVGGALLLVLGFIASGTGIVNLLVPGFDEDTKVQVWQIFCITGFLMPIQIATNLFQGMLNAEGIYGKVEFTSTVSQIANIAILIIWGREGNIWSLVVGLVISVLAQFATTCYYLRQVNYQHSWLLRNPHFPLRELGRTLMATSTYMLSVQVYTFVFNMALSLLPSGSFAIYRYAELIYGKVANVFMMPVSTVFFNEINRLIHKKNSTEVKEFVAKNLNFSYFIAFLVILTFWASGKYFIWSFWAGIKFDASATTEVYELLCLFFLSMTTNGPSLIYRKLAVSVTKPELQYYYWSIIHLISVAIGYFLIHSFGFDGVKIQVLVHCCLMASVPILTVWFYKRVYFTGYQLVEVLKITLALAAGGAVVWGIRNYWNDATLYSKEVSFFIGASLAIGAASFFVISSMIFKVHEINLIRVKILNRIKS
ncbi:lipid II flippase MurJ [Runella sp. MFBS21]|nr:lipid II flippase MurJ [Runella sp. MFBS21]